MAALVVVRGLALLLTLSIGGLPALAAATPPDPLWCPGVFDDGDHDDLVSAAGAPNLPPPAIVQLTEPLVAVTRDPLPEDVRWARGLAVAPRPVRAPPSV